MSLGQFLEFLNHKTAIITQYFQNLRIFILIPCLGSFLRDNVQVSILKKFCKDKITENRFCSQVSQLMTRGLSSRNHYPSRLCELKSPNPLRLTSLWTDCRFGPQVSYPFGCLVKLVNSHSVYPGRKRVNIQVNSTPSPFEKVTGQASGRLFISFDCGISTAPRLPSAIPFQ